MGISGYKYDIRTLKCKKFDGDCRYTNNGFRTLEECEAKCKSKDIFVKSMIGSDEYIYNLYSIDI